MKFDIEEIMVLLASYIEKHPKALSLGGEYIMLNDKAQEDAIRLVRDIFDNAEGEVEE